ncbi:MAG: CadC-family transcriptional regulator [Reyranella sp.]|uniref:adenylate/guanylate cyclase domain-containing protein n=1 Tax=Reyranella sp. TaxID=1929291 RepID=UPI001AC40D3A|nr:adenylate/guanylate cyclase domain-containing protein [Reyranella sp.]MBN9086172.1 CadC-family transcriptional regulator [Reyranella sp.]
MQRRLAAILAADVVGFSALMERDEEGTYAAVGRLRREIVEPRLAEHQGRLIKTTGDGFLAEFASPLAALRSAMALQGDLSRDQGALRLRVGLNLGDVIVAEDGDVYGEGVNVAARLEALCEPGGILISGKIHEEVEGKIDASFEDRGEQQVKNITRPVRIYALRPAGAETAMPLPLPDNPSIAVLPFQNMSGDPDQEYFADGMVEDIITALSRFKSLFVIARNSSFAYKGKAVDIKQVGRELGVRYVLEGSVRKAGNRVRITGQLIEAGTNRHLWADRFDGALEDVFGLQDQVTSSVVSLIAPEVEKAEIERAMRKPTERLDSHDLFMRGMALVYKGQFQPARDFFVRAAERDPDYGAAYAMAAVTLMFEQAARGVPLAAEERAEALRLADRAARTGGDDAFALARAGHVLTYLGRQYDRGMAMTERAVALNPNLAAAWDSRGWVALMSDQPRQSIESFERMLRLSPLDHLRVRAWNGISFAWFALGRYEEGCDIVLKSLQSMKNAHTLSAYIMNAVGAGRDAEAKWAVEELLATQPGFRASHVGEAFPVRSVETGERMAAALREAGLPA